MTAIFELPYEELFYQIACQCCQDGKISSDEFKLLKRLSDAFKIDKDRANDLANNAIKAYKNGKISDSTKFSPTELYQATLLKFTSDGVLDGDEDAILQLFKTTLGANPEKFSAITSSKTASTKKLRLKPLVCGNCKGLVPLLHNEWINCPYCSKKVHIPAIYLDAMAARESINRKMSRVVELKDVVGKFPSDFENLLSYFSDKLIFLFFLIFLGVFHYYLDFFSIYPLSLIYRYFFKANFADVVSPFFIALLRALILYILLAVPFALVYRARRKIFVLEELQFSLAASPPAIPGGPALCNNCGAALGIKHDKHLVICGYCETENLVNLPDGWMDKARINHKSISCDLNQALENYSKETGLLFESLLCLGILFLLYGFIVGGINASAQKANWLPVYSEKSNHRELITREGGREPQPKFDDWNLVTLSYSLGAGGSTSLFFPMKAGEKIEVEWKPDKKNYQVKMEKNPYLKGWKLPNKLFARLILAGVFDSSGRKVWESIESKGLEVGLAESFKAPVSGIYALRIIFPKPYDSFYLKISRRND